MLGWNSHTKKCQYGQMQEFSQQSLYVTGTCNKCIQAQHDARIC